MPRTNPGRSIDSEANLAERVARERKRLGLSYQGLADAMAAAGCPVDRSAMYRIESGTPPRRISVDELVAFSRVFDTSVDELLVPVELIDQARAQELVAGFQRAAETLSAASFDVLETLVEYYGIGEEVGHFVAGHVEGLAVAWKPALDGRLAAAYGADGAYNEKIKISNGLADLFDIVTEVAQRLVAAERGGSRA